MGNSNKAVRFMRLASGLASAIRKDGWENVLTGLGVAGKDKRLGASMMYRPLTEKQLEDLHDGDDIADRVVNLIPIEGTRDWIEMKFKDDDKLTESMVEFTEALDMQARIQKAWAFSRLYRGSAIFLSVDQ